MISTALSTIFRDLSIGEDCGWVANFYLLAGAAVQPLCDQLANLFSQRWPTIAAVALVLLGSGLASGTTNEGMLMVGRALRGVGGGGGINMLMELIMCNLVTLRERPKYNGIVSILFAVGWGIGPFIGGVLVSPYLF